MNRTRQVVSTIAVFAVLSLAGVRALHSEPETLGKAVAKTTTTSSSPCYLCDTPECAIIWPVAVLIPPRVSEHGVLAFAQIGDTREDDIPLHVRPPPVI